VSIKLLSFDLDDTLWPNRVTIHKTEETLYSWFKNHQPQIAEKYSIQQLLQKRKDLTQQNPHLSHDITAIRYLSLHELAQESQFDASQSKLFVQQAFDIYYTARNQVQLYNDIIPVLKKLQSRYKMIAVSNGNADITKTQTGLEQFFEFSWSAAEAGKEKPHPKIFQDIMEKTQLAPHNIIHIGDDPVTDIQGAHNADINAIWLNREQQKWPEELSPPEYEINNLYQLHQILIQLGS
jgi:FMN hydrolase / 5-amino-6-(5-phospho-D-ribitylamino)uracil phosphatase